MPRVAGNSSHYSFVLRNNNTGRYVSDVSIELPSVTTIIKATLAAPQLVGWAYRTTRDNISGMVDVLLKSLPPEELAADVVLDMLADADMLEEYLKENRLRPDDLKDEAAERGSREHAFLERLGNAALSDTEDAAQGIAQACLSDPKQNDFAKGIAGWWLDRNPRVVESERVLFSLKHGFAGSVDLIWVDDEGALTVTDLKTRGAGRVAYESDHIQVGAYSLAYEELSGRAVKRQSVLVVREDGTWLEEVTDFDARSAFLSILETYKLLKGAR